MEELNRKWADYKEALKTIQDVMMYMEKTSIPSTHKTPIHDLGFNLWRDIVIPQTRLQDTLLEFVHQERNSEIINRDLMRNIIKILTVLGSFVYKEDFEQHFLDVSTDFYHLESQHFTGSCDCGDYRMKVERHLNKEKGRMSHYLEN